jgi:acyl carrier protein
MEGVVRRIAAVLARVMEEPALAGRVTPDTSLLYDLGIDSLHMIRFLLEVEEEFNVEIDFESLDTEHLESVKAFCAFALDESAEPVEAGVGD